MNDILQEISNIRLGKKTDIKQSNSNRYMVVINEPDYTQTAYCFSVPVYNGKTNMLPDLSFHFHNRSASFIGSGSTVSFKDNFLLQSNLGSCSIIFQGKPYKNMEKSLFLETSYGMIEASPTMNGLLFRLPVPDAGMLIKSDEKVSFHSVKCNEKYFALMKDQFKPFLTVSATGTLNAKGSVIAPCRIICHKESEQVYTLTMKSESSSGKFVLVEANLHEQKLFQDTTVESLHPKANNAFGGIAFIGNTRQFGEQWLYSRLDFSLLPQLHSKRIRKAILHIPNLNHSTKPLIINRTVKRFCSFGSNWESKIPLSEELGEATVSRNYYRFNIKEIVAQANEKSADFVIHQKTADGKYAVLSTGDSYCYPQILEINYY